MKAIPAIVENDTDHALAAVRAAYSALREAEAQEQKAEKKLETLRHALGMRRIELGKALMRARVAWPKTGPKAKGWGEFLEKEGIDQPRAWELMKLAGYVEVSSASGGHADEIPTLAAAGIDKRPRKSEQPDPPDPKMDKIVQSAPRAGFDLRPGRWQDALATFGMVDTLITDAPYSKRVHDSAPTRRDGVDADGLAPDYEHWSPEDVIAFVEHWSPRTRGWMVGHCDDELIPAYRAAYERMGRKSFQPVPCVITGMTCRMQGDGPSSWAVYAMVARPATAEFVRWGTLPGAYHGPAQPGAENGRGKPPWLMEQLVRDYSRGNDLVCDPLAGYGTTLIAALDLKRRAIGSEVDPAAIEEAHRRSTSSTGTNHAA